jgi:predicted  nucleic acid-binding Zn-ribbon protein
LSIRSDLDRLLDLQALDSERDAALRSRAQLDKGVKAQAALDLAQTEAEQAHSTLTITTRSLKDAELELASVESKIADYEQRMRSGKLTNSREIANVEREIHQLSRQRSALDEKILELMDQAELQRTTTRQKDQRLSEAQQAFTDQRELSQQALEHLNSSISRLELNRASMAQALSANQLYAKYESLRARPASGGLAIAKIDPDRHCGGCHMPVSQQYAERVKEANQLVICENCGRILA